MNPTAGSPAFGKENPKELGAREGAARGLSHRFNARQAREVEGRLRLFVLLEKLVLSDMPDEPQAGEAEQDIQRERGHADPFVRVGHRQPPAASEPDRRAPQPAQDAAAEIEAGERGSD